MKMKALVLACLCVELLACGTVTEPSRVEQPTSRAVQETKPVIKEEKNIKEPSMKKLEEDC